MFPAVTLAALMLGVSALPVNAADEPETAVEDAIEEVVEDVAEKEASDGRPADADVGEASYNTANCDSDEAGKAMTDDGDEDASEEDGEQAMEMDADCEPLPK